MLANYKQHRLRGWPWSPLEEWRPRRALS